MGATFVDRLAGAMNAFLGGIVRFLPGVLAAMTIVLCGILVAWALRALARRALAAARFDRLADSLGATQALARADLLASPSALAASALFWLVLVSFFMASLTALEVAVIDRLITAFFLYLPRVFVALAILLTGFLLANFLARAALLAAVNANLASPRLIAAPVKLLVLILALAMGLEQLQIARSIVLAAFIICFGAVMLALALAFGLGGRDAARRVLDRQLDAAERDGPKDGISHL